MKREVNVATSSAKKSWIRTTKKHWGSWRDEEYRRRSKPLGMQFQWVIRAWPNEHQNHALLEMIQKQRDWMNIGLRWKKNHVSFLGKSLNRYNLAFYWSIPCNRGFGYQLGCMLISNHPSAPIVASLYVICGCHHRLKSPVIAALELT